MKNPNNMTLLKILNPIVCIPSEYNLDEIQDMGFKDYRNYRHALEVKEFKEDLNKQLNEVKEDRIRHMTEAKTT